MTFLWWHPPIIVLIVVANVVLRRWHVTACTCGRGIGWWLAPRHERHALLVTRAVAATGIAGLAVVWHETGLAVLAAIISVIGWWVVRLHGSGKRRWPKRLAGRVRVTAHGRLVVDHLPAHR